MKGSKILALVSSALMLFYQMPTSLSSVIAENGFKDEFEEAQIINDKSISSEYDDNNSESNLKRQFSAKISSSEISGSGYMSQKNFGIIIKDSITVNIISELDVNNEYTVSLLDSEMKIDSVTCKSSYNSKTKSYQIKASFTIPIDDTTESHIWNLSCSISDDTSSKSFKLGFKLKGSSETTSNIIYDNLKPEVNNIQLLNNGESRNFSAHFDCCDKLTGISKLYYRWDNDCKECDWIEYTNISHNPGEIISFSNTTNWDGHIDPREKRSDGSHRLDIKVVDNAGNEYSTSDGWLTSGADMSAPRVKTISVSKDESTLWKDILHFLSLGNFVKDKFSLSFEVEDISNNNEDLETNIPESGIKSVVITEGKDNSEKVLEKLSSEDNSYHYSVPSKQILETWYIKLTDNNNNIAYYSISELLKNNSDVEEFNSIESEKWIFDKDAPEIEDKYTNEIKYNGCNYYNKKGGTFEIKISDEGYLASVSVSEEYTDLDENKSEARIIVNKEYETSGKGNTDFSYKINTLELKTGLYHYSVISKDFANNECEKSFDICVDHDDPKGIIKIASPQSPDYIVDADTDINWVSEKTTSNKYIPVTFQIDTLSSGSEVNNIYAEVIGKGNMKKQFVFSNDELVKSDGKICASFTISTDPSSEYYFPYDDSNVYVINSYIETVSGNKSENIPFTLHVDTDNPVVEKFYVEKKSTTFDKVLNILSFGVFSNDSLILAVTVKDGINDIGIDHVNISYIDSDKTTESKNMFKDTKNDGRYYCEIENDFKIFQSDIIITAVDKLNKNSKNAPNITNVSENKKTDDDNTFVMIENIKPSLTVIMPQSDCLNRNDDEIWYRSHKNSESDNEKYIEVIVQDKESGLKQINMKINGKPVDHLFPGDTSNDIISGIEKDKRKLLDIESTNIIDSSNRSILCSECHYFYSTDSIAKEILPDSNGKYAISFEVVDNAGNVNNDPVNQNGKSYSNSIIEYYIDNENPEINNFIFEPASYDNISKIDHSDFITKFEYGYYFKSEFDLKIIATDKKPSSDLDHVVFRFIPYEDGNLKNDYIRTVLFANNESENAEAKCTVEAGFKGQIFAQVFDKVENCSEECSPFGFVIDESTPVITIEKLPETSKGKDSNGNNIYTDSVQFKVSVVDTQSGLRSISYSKSSELDSYDEIITSIDNNAGNIENRELNNGWIIVNSDLNLVTEVSKIFSFDKNDNDIFMTFTATDRSGNESEPVSSSKFTIDTVNPKISIKNSSDLMNNNYYNKSTEFTVEVTERNFSSDLINKTVNNSFSGNLPEINFSTSEDKITHTAKIVFPEGDFTFSLSGADLAGNKALISYNNQEVSDHFSTSFNVDTTSPKIKTNFKNFGNDDDNSIYFNSEQTAEITVTEHNFYENDMSLRVFYKRAGSSHDFSDEDWHEIGYSSAWTHDGDTHKLRITLKDDGVYRILMNPVDRALNKGEFIENSADHTAVFEIDTTCPELKSRNNMSSTDKGFVFTPFYEVYDEKRKDDENPSISFDDINFDRIEIKSIIYTPTYKNGKELGDIMLSPLSVRYSKPVTEKTFTLSDFYADGVYVFNYEAYDKAGNKSDLICDTYFRMVNTDVLAYIFNSDPVNKTGYYSLMSTDNKAISKKAVDFDDLDILIIKPTEDKKFGTLVLRDDDKEYTLSDFSAFEVITEDISPKASLIKMHLPGEYYSETFRDDGLDTRMYLSVLARDNVYLDLASIHIDNEAPFAVLPIKFKNWHNYCFTKEQTIILTDISEALDDEKTKIYDCPRNGERKEIPHEYDYANKTLKFTLAKGVHHIDISLIDEAGNTWNADRVKYIRVGNFRIYLFAGLIAIVGLTVGLIMYRRKRKYK